MEATLRRLREADRDGDDRIHKIKLTVSFSANDDHTDDLIEWIGSIAQEAGPNYAVEKARLAETLGFGDVMRGTVTLPTDQIQKLIEQAAGYNTSAVVDNVTIKNVRFDIEARVPIFSGRPDSFAILAHPVPAKLLFTSGEGWAEVPGEFRWFNFEGLPASHGRASFKAPG